MKIVARFPVTVLGVLGLTILGLTYMLGIGYDSGGFQSLLYWLGTALSLPFMLVIELFHSAGDGTSKVWHWPVAAVLHIVICYSIDKLIKLISNLVMQKIA